MTAPDYSVYPEMQIISHGELAQKTREGWVLVQMLSESQLAHYNQNICINAYDPMRSGGQPNYNASLSGPAIVVQALCLIGRKEHVVIDDLRTAIAAFRIKVSELEASNKTLETRNEALERKEKHAQNDLQNQKQANFELQASMNQLRTTNKKMEEDIGKLRTEFGAGKVRELLGY